MFRPRLDRMLITGEPYRRLILDEYTDQRNTHQLHQHRGVTRLQEVRIRRRRRRPRNRLSGLTWEYSEVAYG